MDSDIINAPSVSLRDQIAMRMMPNLILNAMGEHLPYYKNTYAEAAEEAYKYADALLAERSKQGITRYGKKK